MSDTNQTAVQWIVRELNNRFIGEIPMHRWDDVRDACQKALAMEREQIIEARKTAPLRLTWPNDTYKQEAEQYYTEQYGNK